MYVRGTEKNRQNSEKVKKGKGSKVFRKMRWIGNMNIYFVAGDKFTYTVAFERKFTLRN